jgi:hypothetical protein
MSFAPPLPPTKRGGGVDEYHVRRLFQSFGLLRDELEVAEADNSQLKSENIKLREEVSALHAMLTEREGRAAAGNALLASPSKAIKTPETALKALGSSAYYSHLNNEALATRCKELENQLVSFLIGGKGGEEGERERERGYIYDRDSSPRRERDIVRGKERGREGIKENKPVSDVASLRSSLASKVSSIKELQSTVKMLEEKIKKSEEEVRLVHSKHKAREGQYCKLQSLVETLRGDLEVERASSAALASKNEELVKAVRQMQGALRLQYEEYKRVKHASDANESVAVDAVNLLLSELNTYKDTMSSLEEVFSLLFFCAIFHKYSHNTVLLVLSLAVDT